MRFHEVYDGYIVEMLTWAFANIHRGKRELLLRNLQICSPGYPEDWEVVDSSDLDPCNDPMDKARRLWNGPLPNGTLHFAHSAAAGGRQKASRAAGGQRAGWRAGGLEGGQRAESGGREGGRAGGGQRASGRAGGLLSAVVGRRAGRQASGLEGGRAAGGKRRAKGWEAFRREAGERAGGMQQLCLRSGGWRACRKAGGARHAVGQVAPLGKDPVKHWRKGPRRPELGPLHPLHHVHRWLEQALVLEAARVAPRVRTLQHDGGGPRHEGAWVHAL